MKKLLVTLTCIFAALVSVNATEAVVDSLSTDCGNTVTITATPNVGYHFVQWMDGVTTNPRQITLTSDTVYTAIFAPDVFTLTTGAEMQDGSDASAYATVTAGGEVTYGQKVTLTATVNDPCYEFVQWSDGETNPTHSEITITSNMTLKAIFRVKTYKIRVQADTTMGGVTISR